MHVKSLVGNLVGLGLVSAVIFTTGCRKNAVDQAAFKSAINAHLSTHQECLWQAAIKFPAQADTSNDDQTKGFDALTDAGMLTRSSAEKKRFLIGSKQVSNYDLSDKGRSTWTADQSQPGYGNFCFGHPEVTTIDSFTPPDNADATRYTVNYHYTVASVPAWASSVEMKNAFPKFAADTSGQQPATATLVKSDQGWQVTNPSPASTQP
jgi:hypothetical protein